MLAAMPPSRMIGNPVMAATTAGWLECMRTGGTWYREHRFRGADGSYHPVLAQGVPIHDENGRLSGWAGINLDMYNTLNASPVIQEQAAFATWRVPQRIMDGRLYKLSVQVDF